MRQCLAALLLTPALLTGCVATPQTDALLEGPPPTLAPATRLSGVPFHPQERYQCGPAALATVLGASGINTSPEQLKPRVYVPERRGAFQVEMLAAARAEGRLAYRLPPDLQALLAEVAAGHPVLVLQNLALSIYPRWHYAVVKGYELASRELILNTGDREDYALSLTTFERTWLRADRWAMVTLRPGELPAQAEPTTYFRAVAALQNSAGRGAAGPAWRAGVERWPRHRELLMGQGNWLYHQGELARAARAFRQVVELNPDYAPAHNNLAQVQFERGHLREAVRLARRAVALGGEHAGDYAATLAAIHSSLDEV